MIHPMALWLKNLSSLTVSKKNNFFNGDECIEGTPVIKPCLVLSLLFSDFF
jgi:hypothetical protein